MKCAYLDPPYNNGESYRHYFDKLGHEEWLQTVTARLVAIRELLHPHGSVWISIDDSELHYLKIACDQVFGRDNFIATIVWERRTTRENRRALSRNHEYLLVYAADSAVWTKSRNLMPLTDDIKDRYRNPDNDARGPWQSVSANVQDGHATPQQFYEIRSPSGRVHQPPKGRCWVYSEAKMQKEIHLN
ncbi:site-specific DNA-methyltransferase, partial [Xanthomonas campestris pv. campestris]|nr:site-specific DNA-methyltransferase [Xanthomonas campestris pv. campestris]